MRSELEDRTLTFSNAREFDAALAMNLFLYGLAETPTRLFDRLKPEDFMPPLTLELDAVDVMAAQAVLSSL